MKNLKLILIGFLILPLFGCFSGTYTSKGGIDDYQLEAQWIRDGLPLEFEHELWYPQDGIETFLEPEVLKVGQYKEVDVFVEKVDIRPYNRLYTRFNKNKFRYYEKKSK
ncbi:MAG: hypothetical protein HQL25_00525 [Candidatus Omnitrophica bacterium]|nr:hypothetical protein [Candidatus Omnitrophota bacterium]